MNKRKIYPSKEPFVPISILIQQAKDGNQAAFSELYNRYIKYISYIINSMIKDPLDAEELIQDTFAKAFTSLDMYTKNHSFGYWLKTIAKNKAIDWIRKKDGNEYSLSIDDDNGISNKHTDNSNAITQLIEISEKEALKEMVSKLKWKDRRIFKLRYIDNLKYEEIASKLGVTIGTVKSHLHNVKTKLLKLAV